MYVLLLPSKLSDIQSSLTSGPFDWNTLFLNFVSDEHSVWLFCSQVLFHQLFMQMLDDLVQYVVANGYYAIEFQQKGAFLFIHLRFWRENQLCGVLIKRTGRVGRLVKAEVGLLGSLLAAISTRPSLVCCNGSFLDLVQN